MMVTFDREAVDYIYDNSKEQGVVSLRIYDVPSGVEGFLSSQIFDVSLTCDGETVIHSIQQGIMKLTIFEPNLQGQILAGSLTAEENLVYLNKSLYDGEKLMFFENIFGGYGITRRANTSLMDSVSFHWGAEYLRFLDARRVYQSMDTVEANASITRGMFVEILGKLEQVEPTRGNVTFTDVSDASSYSVYVQWAYENGLVAGYGDGTFAPDAPIDREEMAVMLLAYIRYTGNVVTELGTEKNFSDEGNISFWAKDAVAQASVYGLIEGNEDGTFTPNGETTYTEHAVMVKALLENILSYNTIELP